MFFPWTNWWTTADFIYPGLFLTLVGFVWRHAVNIHWQFGIFMNYESSYALISTRHMPEPENKVDTLPLPSHKDNTLPHQFLGVHMLRSTLIPQVFSTSSFWSLAVCKNGGRRPSESYQVISCVLTMVSFPGFPYHQCLITFSTRITSFPDSLAP